MTNFKFIDLFAGIGGFHLAAENAGGKCVFASENDFNALTTYKRNFPNFHNIAGDITTINAKDIQDFDVLFAGFPCQPFSVAGKRKGFEDERGNLFFDIVRILKEKQPKTFVLENVKNLKTHNNSETITTIYKELEKVGYTVVHTVLNASEYGNVPQNRERLFIVGFLDKAQAKYFTWPQKLPLTKTIHDCLEQKVADKYYYNDKPLFEKLKNDVIRKDTVYQWRRKYVRANKSHLCPTLTANMGTGGHNVPIILDDFGIRKLTPQECANFQGFDDSFQLNCLADSHLYKQIGNSVCVPLVERLIIELF